MTQNWFGPQFFRLKILSTLIFWAYNFSGYMRLKFHMYVQSNAMGKLEKELFLEHLNTRIRIWQ